MGSRSLFGYFESVNWFNNPKWISKKNKIEENFENLFNGIAKIIGWLILLALLAGLGYLFFGFLGSLSVSTLLIIIIVILLLK